MVERDTDILLIIKNSSNEAIDIAIGDNLAKIALNQAVQFEVIEVDEVQPELFVNN